MTDLPAWIQAIGSIVAILIAAWVPYQSNKNQLTIQNTSAELRRKNTLLLLLPTLYLIKRTIFEFLEENNPNTKDLFGDDIEEFNSNYFELIPHFSQKIQSLMDSDFKHDLLTRFCFELFKAEEHLNENSYLQRRGYHAAWLNHQDLFIEEAKNLHILVEKLIENIEEMNSQTKPT
ncbi:hypothetical protein [Acinetobacter variabilis]|uniref:hypothetical protein n=1 Tax=Acinetobacter variabilis TaxID=70346 RepID=UPI00254A4078|nr:hypothetical protein [Acinetobacter variabilis]